MNKDRFIIFLLFYMGIFMHLGLLLAQDVEQNPPFSSGELFTKSFSITPSFVQQLIGTWYEGGFAADPFADPAESDSKTPIPVFPGLMGAMKMFGISIPEGGFIIYNPQKGKLEVRGDIGTMELVEAYIESYNTKLPKQLNIRTEIYQMPAKAALKIQQLCGPMDDHTPMWKKVQVMVERGQASLVTSSSTIARSGQRAKVHEVSEVIYPTEVKWDAKEETVLPASFETRNVGTTLEVDPVLGADQFTVDLSFSLEHHTAPPIMRPVTVTSPNTGRVVVVEMPEMHTKKMTTQLTMGINSSKCIGAWRPTGKPEYEKENVMQIVFLRVDLQTTGKVVPWEE